MANTYVSFPVKLAGEWQWNEAWRVGCPLVPNCSDFTPPPGELCVFIENAVNISGDTVAIFDPISGAAGSTGSELGVGISAAGNAVGHFYASGRWAATAP